jgi:hypothetical protein
MRTPECERLTTLDDRGVRPANHRSATALRKHATPPSSGTPRLDDIRCYRRARVLTVALHRGAKTRLKTTVCPDHAG